MANAKKKKKKEEEEDRNNLYWMFVIAGSCLLYSYGDGTDGIFNNIILINSFDSVDGAAIMAQPLWEFTWWM